jgi:hypothetical protein
MTTSSLDLAALAQIALAAARIDRNEGISGDGGKRKISLIGSLQHKVKRKLATFQGLGARLHATLGWMAVNCESCTRYTTLRHRRFLSVNRCTYQYV